MKKIIAHILLFVFSYAFCCQTANFLLNGKSKSNLSVIGIVELEEDNTESEESKEKEEEDLKFNDYNLLDNLSPFAIHLSASNAFLALHFFSSDYSRKVFSPPESV